MAAYLKILAGYLENMEYHYMKKDKLHCYNKIGS